VAGSARRSKKKTVPPAEIAEILTLMGEVADRFEPQADAMKHWMAENLKPALGERFQDMTVLAWQVLDVVGREGPVNGITIARQTRIPKGSVSKITRRMRQQKLITGESLPDNKKEVLFRTTPLGQELYVAHCRFDEQMQAGFVRFLEQYSAAERALMVRVLRDLTQAKFL